jgi:NADPH:quinone reductase-like Zn-dependent oxidoreductase
MSRTVVAAHLGGMKVPLALVFVSIIPVVGAVVRVLDLAGVARAEDHARFAADPLPALLHVVAATLFLVLGAFQFAPALRRRRWHRVVGFVLAPLGLVAAGAGIAIVLRYPPRPVDGVALSALRVGVGSAMFAFIVVALVAVARRDFVAHGRWMTRAFALGAGAGTQVFTLAPLVIFGAAATPRGTFVAMAAGWAINVVVAEWALRRRRAPVPAAMLALHHDRYGGPEHLRLAPAPLPEPRAGEVRVRVRAASINAMDYRILRADPFLVRLTLGFFRPKVGRLGADLAGVVDAVGSGVAGLAVGDEVFGESFGTFAEAIVVRARDVVKKPAALSFVEAAALPLAAITALQAVRDRARVGPGQRVLVQGAGGGVGTFLVQLAKAYGAHVTAVCGPGSIEMVRELGADRVLDYTREDVGRARFDAIFGVNGFRPLAEYRARLLPGGVYVMIGGTGRQLFEALLLGKVRFLGSGRRIEILTIDDTKRAADLGELRGWVERGRLGAVIDRVFPFRAASEALSYVERGHVRGKVVLEVAGR